MKQNKLQDIVKSIKDYVAHNKILCAFIAGLVVAMILVLIKG